MMGHQLHQDGAIVLLEEKNSWHLRLGVAFRLLFVRLEKNIMEILSLYLHYCHKNILFKNEIT